MITLQYFYFLAGALFAAFAVLSIGDGSNRKRLGNTAFWGLLAVSFLGGSYIGDFANGLIVLALVVLGGFGLLGIGKPATTFGQPAKSSTSTAKSPIIQSKPPSTTIKAGSVNLHP